jgi:hypothetical protein
MPYLEDNKRLKHNIKNHAIGIVSTIHAIKKDWEQLCDLAQRSHSTDFPPESIQFLRNSINRLEHDSKAITEYCDKLKLSDSN